MSSLCRTYASRPEPMVCFLAGKEGPRGWEGDKGDPGETQLSFMFENVLLCSFNDGLFSCVIQPTQLLVRLQKHKSKPGMFRQFCTCTHLLGKTSMTQLCTSQSAALSWCLEPCCMLLTLHAQPHFWLALQACSLLHLALCGALCHSRSTQNCNTRGRSACRMTYSESRCIA